MSAGASRVDFHGAPPPGLTAHFGRIGSEWRIPFTENIDTGDSPRWRYSGRTTMRIRNHEETPLGVLFARRPIRARPSISTVCARVFIEAEEPGRGRLALNGEWWIVSGNRFLATVPF